MEPITEACNSVVKIKYDDTEKGTTEVVESDTYICVIEDGEGWLTFINKLNDFQLNMSLGSIIESMFEIMSDWGREDMLKILDYYANNYLDETNKEGDTK